MKCGRTAMLVCLAVACAIVAEASVLKENLHISPKLQPESSKQFDKDYPGDKRPQVDVLHFKHPYPVVQDAEDFDKDFVKDENTDNGEWKAQTEYDRLRHQLRKLKKDAADALAKKNQEKKDLEAAMKKHDEAIEKDRVEIAKKSKEIVKPVKPDKPEKPEKPVKPVKVVKVVKKEPEKPKPTAAPAKKPVAAPQGSWEWPWKWSWPKAEPTKAPEVKKPEPTPKPTPKPKPAAPIVDTSDAEKAIKQAIKSLEGCKDELAEAKAELQKLMDELEKAKIKQVEAREKLSQAKIKQAEADKREGILHTKYTAESKEHAEAEAAYLKQKAVYEKLHRDLQFASTKVKAMRDAEDMGGGVYPKATQQSSASSISAFGLILSVVAIGQM